MRALTAIAVLLTAVTLTAPAPASAVGETCRGEAATIVGKGNTIIRGTDGRDVVVTNNAGAVFTRAGDDLVCVTGRAKGANATFEVTMDTGRGNDIVDSTMAPRAWPVALNLGPGADEFAGGVASDIVISGPGGETDRDVLRGGDGSDELISRGGPDDVYGDRSIDYLVVPSATDGVLDGGEGRDEISIDMDDARWVVDLATGASRNDVATHTWTSVETLSAYGDIGHLVVAGTDGPDEIKVFPRRGARPLLAVDTGRGADAFLLFGGLQDTSGIDLGAGRDGVRLDRDGDLSLNLRSGVLVMGGVADVKGVEDATTYGRKTVLTGTSGRNELRAGQCDTVIRGLGGADDLTLAKSHAIGISCGEIAKASEIDGGAGRDVCTSALRRTNCERTD